MGLSLTLAFCLLALLLPEDFSVSALPANSYKRQSTDVPSYVRDYAPIVWLQSQDPYFPSDIGAQLSHTKPEINFAAVNGAPNPLTLDNLASLNNLGGSKIFLTSVDDITKNPAWLKGVKPDANGKTNGATSATVVVNDHGAGNVDAFYFYFYAYNQGNTVFGQELGDHVGDWEHNMVRFKNGVPQSVWYSQHSYGEAFTYACLEKQGQRPVAYSAKGSHATYATSGTHDHTIPGLNLPGGPLEDHTDKGAIYDPISSANFFRYDAATGAFTAYDGSSPTSWLQFVGQWGDEQYPKSDPRQKAFLGISAASKFVSGPTGPRDKALNRTEVCPPNDNIQCFVSPALRP